MASEKIARFLEIITRSSWASREKGQNRHDADFWQLSLNGIEKRRKNYSWSWSCNQDFSHGDDVMDLKLK